MFTSGNTRGLTMIMIAVLLVTTLTTAAARKDHVRHHHLDRTRVYEPAHYITSAVSDEWPYVQYVIRYPNATGTSVLDEFSGREPVISDDGCGYSDKRWDQMRRRWALMAPE